MNSLSLINNVRANLEQSIVQRNDVIESLFVAAMSGEHLFLYGPAGVGKSMALRLFAKCFSGTNYFEILMTKFTMPEEIWGPLSTQGLKEDRYRRNLKGRFAEAELAFLDEIYKSNSAILNSLLKALNERQFDDDGVSKTIPLRTVIAASNEVPSDDSGLEALADRLALRLVVNPVEGEAARDAVTWDDWSQFNSPEKLTWEAFDEARAHAFSLPISEDAKTVMRAIVDDIRAAKIVISDRRIQKAAKIVRCAAALHNKSEVTANDLAIVRNIFWNKPSEEPIVKEIVEKHCASWLKNIRAVNERIAQMEEKLSKTVIKPKMEKMMELSRMLAECEEGIEQAVAKVRCEIESLNNQSSWDAFTSLTGAHEELKNKIKNSIRESVRQ